MPNSISLPRYLSLLLTLNRTFSWPSEAPVDCQSSCSRALIICYLVWVSVSVSPLLIPKAQQSSRCPSVSGRQQPHPGASDETLISYLNMEWISLWEAGSRAAVESVLVRQALWEARGSLSVPWGRIAIGWCMGKNTKSQSDIPEFHW